MKLDNSMQADNHETSAVVILISLSLEINQRVTGSNQMNAADATNIDKLPANNCI